MPTAQKPQSILLFVAFIVFIDMMGIGLIIACHALSHRGGNRCVTVSIGPLKSAVGCYLLTRSCNSCLPL